MTWLDWLLLGIAVGVGLRAVFGLASIVDDYKIGVGCASSAPPEGLTTETPDTAGTDVSPPSLEPRRSPVGEGSARSGSHAPALNRTRAGAAMVGDGWPRVWSITRSGDEAA